MRSGPIKRKTPMPPRKAPMPRGSSLSGGSTLRRTGPIKPNPKRKASTFARAFGSKERVLFVKSLPLRHRSRRAEIVAAHTDKQNRGPLKAYLLAAPKRASRRGALTPRTALTIQPKPVDRMASTEASTPEVWRAVVGFEGLYEVSDHGRLRSVTHGVRQKNGRPHTVRGRLLNAKPNTYGYPRTTLHNAGTLRRVCIHQLVAEAFIGPAPGPTGSKGNVWTVDHKDGIKTNNTPGNLEWCLRGDNSRRAAEANPGRHKGERSAKALLTSTQAERIYKVEYPSGATCAALARTYGISERAVYDLLKGRTYADVTGGVDIRRNRRA